MHRDVAAVTEGIFRQCPVPLALCLAGTGELLFANDSLLEQVGGRPGADDPPGRERRRTSPGLQHLLREACALADQGEQQLHLPDGTGSLRSYRVAVESLELSDERLCLVRLQEPAGAARAKAVDSLHPGGPGRRPPPAGGGAADQDELRRQLDQARELEVRWRSIVDMLPFPLTLREPEGRLLFANRAVADTLRSLGTGRDSTGGAQDQAFTVLASDAGGQPGRSDPPSKVEGRGQKLPFVVPTEFPRAGQAAVLRVGVEASHFPVPTAAAASCPVTAEKVKNIEMLSGALSHRANNLLTAVLGNVDLASMKLPVGAPALAYLAGIKQATDELSSLWQQALLCTRPRGDAPTALSWARLIREIAPLLELIPGKQSTLSYDIASAVPSLVGDSSDCRHLLLSMVGSLLRSTRAAAGQVRLRCAVQPAREGTTPGPGEVGSDQSVVLELSFVPRDPLAAGSRGLASTLADEFVRTERIARHCGGQLSFHAVEEAGLVVRVAFPVRAVAHVIPPQRPARGELAEAKPPQE